MTTVQKILRMVTRSNEAEPQSETESDEVTEIFEKYNSLGDQLSIVRCQAFIRQYLAMTKKQKYLSLLPSRNNKVREIFETEVKYAESLEQVIEIYIKPLRVDAMTTQSLITRQELKEVFAELEIIQAVSRTLIKHLQERLEKWFPNQKIGDVFGHLIDFFKIYTQYVINYPKAMETLAHCKQKNAAFQQFIKEREQKTGCIIPIENFLIMPVQRIPRYALLMEELLNLTWEEHPDFPYLKKACVRIQEVAAFVNEQKRYRENLTKILEIYNSLTGIKTETKSAMLIGQKNVWYIQDGSVWEVMMSGRLRRYHVFLFNVFLIFTKPPKNNQYEFVKSVTLDSTAKVEPRTADEGLKMVYLSTKDGLFMFRGETNEETQEWLQKITNIVSGQFNPNQEKKEREKEKEVKTKEKNESGDERRNTTKAQRQFVREQRHSSREHYTPTLLPKKLKELKEREDLDRLVAKKIEEETRILREWERSEESDEIDKIEVASSDLNSFDCFSQEVYNTFHEFITSVTNANISWEVPEVLLIGRKEDGKTSIVESLLGHILPPYSRPVFWHLVNNPKKEKPQIAILKETSPSEIGRNSEGIQIQNFVELETELMNRSKTFSLTPIHITYESKNVFNMTIIDPPGLDSFNIFEEWYQFYDASKKKGRSPVDERELVKDYISDLSKNEKRILIFVEECKDITVMPNITKIAFKFDPTLSRSLFIYTKFAYKLRDFTEPHQCSMYLNLTRMNCSKAFLTTYISPKVRQKLRNDKPNEYRIKLLQFYKRDLKYLEALQFDKSFLDSVGSIEARKYILNLIVQHYQRIIPIKLTQLQTMKSELEEKQHKRRIQSEELNDIMKLRHIAFDYVSIFCDKLNRLFEEYSLKNAERIGQTIKEEFEASGLNLETKYGKQLPLDRNQITMTWNKKCYGRVQLIRMFTVFEHILQSVLEKNDNQTPPSNDQNLKVVFDDLRFLCQYVLKRLAILSVDETLPLMKSSPPKMFVKYICNIYEKEVEKTVLISMTEYENNLVTQLSRDSSLKNEMMRAFVSHCYQMIGIRGMQEILRNLQTKIFLTTDDEIRTFWKTESVQKETQQTSNELNSLNEDEKRFILKVNSFLKLTEHG